MKRTRRLRSSRAMRDLVRENRVYIDDLVYPVFVAEGENIKRPVESMPGVYQWSLDRIHELVNEVTGCGVKAMLVFGIPLHKDETGSQAYDPDGIAQRAVRRIKDLAPDMVVISDVCLCEYTSHGHCGLVEHGRILNDETLPLLAKASVSLANAGADMIAPSDMMDGRIGYIRNALDEAGFANTPIMAYSAKFASSYYSPFRDAADSAPAFGDRKTYQMDPANGREAVRECLIDAGEGADILIIKPGLPYLDVLKEMSRKSLLPLASYNVSGEYSMVKAAARQGWIDEKRIVMENMIAMKRAGADIIITYHALDVARWLAE
ncbi:MAG: porphobilinogen synthase [Eubacteriales bacterium]|nr:porphobilinogen synthase [Eubacteriales bacterium]